jgi:hypothetical protein
MPALTRTARMTGLLYLGLAITGVLGFLIVRPQIFAADDPNATLANLVAHESRARAGVALELGMVVTQTLAAAWFYRLFRTVDSFAASGIAAFGLVNAIVVLVSAALLATAVEVSVDPVGDAAANVQVLHLASDNLWGVGALFFGLWLIPMGLCVLRSGWMPRVLGWILVGGGVGYVLSAFIRYLARTHRSSSRHSRIPRPWASSGWSATCSSAACAGRRWTRRRQPFTHRRRWRAEALL